MKKPPGLNLSFNRGFWSKSSEALTLSGDLNLMPQSDLSPIEKDTQNRNTLNSHYQAVKGNEKILNDINFSEAVKKCQQMLAAHQIFPIETAPLLANQNDILLSLPVTLREAILYINKETRFDILTCTIALLTSISIALCGRFRVALKPAWEEAVLLSAMLIAESGSQKDSVINLLRYPLDQVMSELQADYDNNVTQINWNREVKTKAFTVQLSKDIKKLSKACEDAQGSSDYDKLMEEADVLCERASATRIKLAAMKARTRQSLFFSDSTEKGLIDALWRQGGHHAAMECEAGFIEKILQLGPRFNIDILLDAYNQKDYNCKIDGEPNSLIKPSLNLLYCVQPVLAAKFFWKYADNERGLAPRFIPVFSYKPINASAIGAFQFATPATSDYSRQFHFFSETVKSILGQNFTQDLRREIYTLKVTPYGLASLEGFEQHNKHLVQNFGDRSSFLTTSRNSSK
jgi:hypothetical protein